VGRLTFVKNDRGRVIGFDFEEGSSPSRFAKRIELFKEEEVLFRNGEVTLAGTLLLPAKPGAHPAMVCIHAGQDQTRRSFGPPPYFFAAHGVAVLIYDKRGNGASTGDWRQASFDDLAGDALAGIELLKRRPDINPRQIGLWGRSQGPWPAWLAASKSKDVAYVIAISGPAVSPARQALFVTENTLRDDAFDKDSIREGLAFQELTDEIARGHKTWEELETAIRNVKDKKWFQYLRPAPKESWFWKWWPKVMDFDPGPPLERVTAPTLAIYGGVDKLVNADESVPILKKALKRAGNKDYTVKVFPKGNHDIYEADLQTSKQYARLKGYVPRYFDTMINWLLKRVNVKT
jgi:dipeptidyl aminopeptidase/acylaminoacyl peptidase